MRDQSIDKAIKLKDRDINVMNINELRKLCKSLGIIESNESVSRKVLEKRLKECIARNKDTHTKIVDSKVDSTSGKYSDNKLEVLTVNNSSSKFSYVADSRIKLSHSITKNNSSIDMTSSNKSNDDNSSNNVNLINTDSKAINQKTTDAKPDDIISEEILDYDFIYNINNQINELMIQYPNINRLLLKHYIESGYDGKEAARSLNQLNMNSNKSKSSNHSNSNTNNINYSNQLESHANCCKVS